CMLFFFFFSSRRRHTRSKRDWSSDVCSSDLRILALRDVSFELEKGSTVGVVGPNGCGKSTLLQIIAGTLEPTHGNVWHEGRVAEIGRASCRERVYIGVGDGGVEGKRQVK